MPSPNSPGLHVSRSAEDLETRLRTLMRGRRNGFRLPADQELALRFEVSVPTLRKALHELQGEGWIAPAPGRGWQVTAKARYGRVALWYDANLTLSGGSHLARLQYGKERLEALGYDVGIYLGNARPGPEAPLEITCRQLLRDHEEGLFSGVLALWGYMGDEGTQALFESGVPVVGLASFYANMVTHDTQAYLRRALAELRRRGRRKVAFLGAMAEWNIGGRDSERLLDARELIRDTGFEVHDEWVRQEWHHSTKAGRWSALRELWTARRERPDAVILPHAVAWEEIRQALDSFGVTPGREVDLVVAREESALRGRPPLPGVMEFHFDTEALVEQAVSLLDDLLCQRPVTQRRHLMDAWQYAGDPITSPTPVTPSATSAPEAAIHS